MKEEEREKVKKEEERESKEKDQASKH